jgi:putative flippase GtrA
MRPVFSLASTQVRLSLLSPAARPLRFIGTGVTAAAIQLGILTLLIHLGWHDIPANIVAFLLAAQVNFALSYNLTWHDRHAPGTRLRCWLLFHGSIALMALLNMLVFLAARSMAPAVVASALGIGAGALGNYLTGDRLVFHRRRVHDAPARLVESVA